jgi:DNA-binding transcriptional LysR family regulator
VDQLLALRVFVRIADAGSFAKAADSLNLPRSSVSKLLQDLEEHLGARLVERSTRALTITPAGLAYREHAIALLADLDQMDAGAASALASPRGRLRVDVGSSLANLFIIPALADFRRRFPDIELMLGVNDRPVDIIGDGVDCVIRGGVLPDSSLVARQLATLSSVTCATPDYFAVHGTPTHPTALTDGHTAICYFFPQTGKSLPLRYSRRGETHELAARSAISVSESTAQIQAVLEGLGIGQIFRFSVRDHLASGRLVTVFDDWEQPSLPLHLVYPSSRHPNAKTRAFAEWVVELFDAHPR